MSEDQKENQPIEDPQEQNTGSENTQDNLGESGQDEIPEKGKLNKGPEQKAENNPGDVFQQIIESGNHNTQTQIKNQQVPENGNGKKENRTDKQVTDGNNNNQNHIELVFNNILGEGKDADKKYSFNKNNYIQFDGKQKLTDPTKKLPVKPKYLPDVRGNLSDYLSDYSKKLQEDYLVVVSCSDYNTALSVGYSLSEEILVSNKRIFTEELGSYKKLDVEIDINNIVFHPAIGKEESSLIVVDSYEIQTFLDSLVVRSSAAELIKQQLKNRQRFCICIAESKVLETTLERKKIKSLSFPHLEVPLVEEKATDESLDERQVTASSLYKKADNLRRTVLYVATFFPGLDFGKFDRILCLLLGEQTTLIKEKNKVEAPVNGESTVSLTMGYRVITFNESQQPLADKSVNQPKAKTKKLLRDIWEEKYEKILKYCYLEPSLNEYSSIVMDFSLPHLRSELKQYFEEKKFIEYRKKFLRLIELNLLFDTSPQVAKAFKDLSVAMMLFERRVETWVDWLVKIFIETLEFNTDGKSKDLQYIYYCIVSLLRETLNYSELEDILEVFLNKLIDEKRHKAVIEISKRLRLAPLFNEYYWFNQCINRGSEEVRQETYKVIYNITKQSGLRVYEILEKLKGCLPDLERDPNTYSFSNKYALLLLPEYSEETLNQFDTKLYGEQAFNYPLFGGLQSDEFVDSRLKMIVEWLVHPGLDSVVNNDDVDSLLIISVQIFPGLFNILLGLNEDLNIKPEVSNIVDSLLQAINNVTEKYKKITNKEYREFILDYWRFLSDFLLKVSNYEIRVNNNWEKGEQLNYRRNVIDYLIERLEAFPRQ